MIDRKRLATTFVELCETDSPSRHEGRMAALLKNILGPLAPDEVFEDDSAEQTGSESGNLFFRFNGTLPEKPVFFNCHMDTVQPGVGVRVRRQGDLFTSAGDTILGSDDKSGIAALIEAMRVLREQQLPFRTVEYVFTTCEEIGLLGAKALDPAHIQARFGYSLDSSGFGRVIIGAPAANRLRIAVHGHAAHAGLHPEWGINAMILAARALARVPDGRIDPESTVNFGIIHGGIASNIVPEKVVLEGEVRSHSEEKLTSLTGQIEEIFRGVIQDWQDAGGQARGKPGLDFVVEPDFPMMHLDQKSAVIREIQQAGEHIGLDLTLEVAGGGSDANIFNGYGLETAIVATGMTNVHSTDEQVELDDMVRLTELILALLTGQGKD